MYRIKSLYKGITTLLLLKTILGFLGRRENKFVLLLLFEGHFVFYKVATIFSPLALGRPVTQAS